MSEADLGSVHKVRASCLKFFSGRGRLIVFINFLGSCFRIFCLHITEVNIQININNFMYIHFTLFSYYTKEGVLLKGHQNKPQIPRILPRTRF